MTHAAPVCRPKVFRRPAPPARKPVNKVAKLASDSAPYLVFGVLFFMLAMSSAPATKTVPQARSHKTEAAKLIPQISVTPTQLALNQQPEHLPASLTEKPLARASETIVLQGQSDAIIGQMARIPMENEHITEVKPTQDVDNVAGRELLSIINKY